MIFARCNTAAVVRHPRCKGAALLLNILQVREFCELRMHGRGAKTQSSMEWLAGSDMGMRAGVWRAYPTGERPLSADVFTK
jgi:hypothetical protein